MSNKEEENFFSSDEGQKAIERLNLSSLSISNDEFQSSFVSTEEILIKQKNIEMKGLLAGEDDFEDDILNEAQQYDGTQADIPDSELLREYFQYKNYNLESLDDDYDSSNDEREDKLPEGYRPGDDFDEDDSDEENEANNEPQYSSMNDEDFDESENRRTEEYQEILDEEFTDFIGFVEDLDPVFPPNQPSLFNFLEEDEEERKEKQRLKNLKDAAKNGDKELLMKLRLPPSIPPLSKGKSLSHF